MTENTTKADNNNQSYAAIDLGSNSFHMIVCRINDGELLVEDRLRETVSLGSGLDKKNNLTPEIQERALACLEGFGQRLSNIPSENVRVVGTNTLRRAKNSWEFIQKAERALGHEIEIVSGVEEARLIYLGVAHGISTDGERRLVVDIGGGSTELIIGSGFIPMYLESLHMGCVTFNQRYFSDGSITQKTFKQAEIAARMELEPVQSLFKRLGWENAIGASGSIRSIRSVVREAQWSEEGITIASLKNLRDALIETGHVDKIDFKGLSAERKPVFAGGVVILLAIFKALGIERMQVSDSALREGLVQELLGPVQQQPDVRSNAVINLARRYHTDETQAQLVKETAQECARQVAADWKLNLDETNKWLDWATQLHEIGLDISHSQYHKHGAYIAEHVDLAGFSRQEQQVLAALVRNHRRKIAKDYLKRLADYRYQPTLYWTILLRLAVVLHRSRITDPLPAFNLKSKKKSLQIQFPDEWLDGHALTRGDLEQEANYLSAMDFTLEYA